MPNETSWLTPGPPADPGMTPFFSVFFSVVRGHPTDDELAAVVTVLAARAGTAAAAAYEPTPARALRSRWSDKSRLMRTSLAPGPDAWRRSALPR